MLIQRSRLVSGDESRSENRGKLNLHSKRRPRAVERVREDSRCCTVTARGRGLEVRD